MTREKAARIIKECKEKGFKHTFYTLNEYHTALDMALEALEQEQTIRNCFGCKYSKDNHNAGMEECHLCMWENQYTPTTKNDLGVDCISRADALALYCDKCGLYNCISKCASYRAVEKMPSVTPQEPFINKPCVAGEVCEHDKQKVLDKIRAEIEQITDTMGVSYNQYVSKIDVLQILDKYKAENEE